MARKIVEGTDLLLNENRTVSLGAKVFATIAFPNTVIWDGGSASPNTFTDLDLSAIVGKNSALCFIEAYRSGTDPGIIYSRMNGTTKTPLCYTGYAMDLATANWIVELIVTTDTNGVIEWATDTAQTGVVMTLRAYIRQ